MNILIAGGPGGPLEDIVNKLKKEGHRVYILAGTSIKNHTYNRKVFETYYFPYDCACMNEIYESVNPDVLLFMGAYDTNFQWKDSTQDSVTFYAGLSNLLLSYSQWGKGRFVYLSSHEVFLEKEDSGQPIQEKDTKGRIMTLHHGWEMCESYRKKKALDILTLHLDHLYGMPGEITDLCGRMCLEAVQEQKVIVHSKDKFSMLYYADAVEAIYKIIACEAHEESVYIVSSGQTTDEMELANMVAQKAGASIEIVDHSHGVGEDKVLSGDKFEKEFSFVAMHQMEHTIKQMILYMRKHKQAFGIPFLEDKIVSKFPAKIGRLVREMIPYLENLICFIPFFMLNNRAVGSDYFANLDFYLLYVLLFAIIYGQFQAIFSSVLAMAGYFFRQMYHRTGFDVILDYNTYVWIAQLFILGLVVGYLRDQLRVTREEKDHEITFLKKQLEDIKDINSSNVRMKMIMETQIVNQDDSVGTIYEITSRLDQYAPEEVLFYAAEMLNQLMESQDVAIYNISGDYARLFTFTSDMARSMGNSFRVQDLGEIYEALTEKRVYINKRLEEGYPLMANAVYSEDNIQLIIMIWGIPWEYMTLKHANRLVIISYLIQNALVRANRYLEALENQRYVGGTNILETKAFRDLVRAYAKAKGKGLTECSVLKLNVLPEEQEEAARSLQGKLRSTDYLGRLEDGFLFVLLPNTGTASAEVVMEKFKELGYGSHVQEEVLG